MWWWWVVRSMKLMMPSVTGTQTWRVRRHARLECRLPCPLAAACWETATGAQPPFGVRATGRRCASRKGATSRGENESLSLCIVFLSASPPVFLLGSLLWNSISLHLVDEAGYPGLEVEGERRDDLGLHHIRAASGEDTSRLVVACSIGSN